MTIKEVKGDIKFLEDERGNLFQQIAEGLPFKVVDGSMKYKGIKTVNGKTIKYNLNGVHGFSIWDKHTNFEDNIWILSEAERIATEL
jgi:hypothetical protein